MGQGDINTRSLCAYLSVYPSFYVCLLFISLLIPGEFEADYKTDLMQMSIIRDKTDKR